MAKQVLEQASHRRPLTRFQQKRVDSPYLRIKEKSRNDGIDRLRCSAASLAVSGACQDAKPYNSARVKQKLTQYIESLLLHLTQNLL